MHDFSNENVDLPPPEEKDLGAFSAPVKPLSSLPAESQNKAVLDALIRHAGEPLALVLNSVGATYDQFKAMCQEDEFIEEIKDRVRREVVMPALPNVVFEMVRKAADGDDKAMGMFLKSSDFIDTGVQVNQQFNFSDMSTSSLISKVESLRKQLQDLDDGDIIDIEGEERDEEDGIQLDGGVHGGTRTGEDDSNDVR